jgi:hypothetical protein
VAGAPLNVLLAHALLDLTRAAERADPNLNVVFWANVLRVVGDGGAAPKTMHLDARVSRRAMKTLITHGVAKEALQVGRDAVALTDVGRLLRDEWDSAVAAAEADWPHTESLRAPLSALVGALDLELPHYPVPYGGSDVSFTGGPGVDWKPLPRDVTADTTSGLPLLAMLSQAFTAFGIDYEWRQRGALHLGVHLAAVDWPRSLADAPVPLEINGSGKSGLERHGLVVATDGVVELTRIGEIVRSSYAPLCGEVESSWRERYGDSNVGALRGALESVEVALTERHADIPWVRHRPGVGFTEVSGASS